MRRWRYLERRRAEREALAEREERNAKILTMLPWDPHSGVIWTVISMRTQIGLTEVNARLHELIMRGLVLRRSFDGLTTYSLTEKGCAAAERAAGYDYDYKVDVNSAYGKLGRRGV